MITMKRIGLFFALLSLGQIVSAQTLSSLNPTSVKSFREGLAKVEINNKCGFIDKNMNVVIDIQFDNEWSFSEGFSEGLAVVKKDGRWGYIDKNGRIVIPLQFDEARDFHNGLAAVRDNNEGWIFIDNKGNRAFSWSSVYEPDGFSDGLAAVLDDEDGRHYGFIDMKGSLVIPMRYEYFDDIGAAPFTEGLARIYVDEKYGFIDKQGNVVIPTQYDNALLFSEGLAAVEKDGRWGYIDKNGRVVIPMQFDYADDFSEGMAAVQQHEEWGFVDKQGNVVIPCQFHGLSVPFFKEGLALVVKSGKCFYIDKKGNSIIPINGDNYTLSFSEGFAAVKEDGKWFYIDKNGRTINSVITVNTEVDFVITEEFSNKINSLNLRWCCPFREGLATVYTGTPTANSKKIVDNRCGVIDKQGNLMISLQYDDIGEFHEGLARVREIGKNKLGFIDKRGRIVIPTVYDGGGYHEMYFKEGLARVLKDGKDGFLNKNGSLVFSTDYELHKSVFCDGRLLVYKTVTTNYANGGKSTHRLYGYLDKNGKVAIPLKYDQGDNFNEGLARVALGGEWKFIDTDGNVAISLNLSYYSPNFVTNFHEGLATLYKDGKYGYIDKTGNLVIPIQFDGANPFSEGLAAVRKNGKWGFIDKKGKIVIPLQFDFVWDFHEGMARVSKLDENENPYDFGVIDKSGRIIYPLEYENIPYDFQEGLAPVYNNGQYGYIDKHGNTTLR